MERNPTAAEDAALPIEIEKIPVHRGVPARYGARFRDLEAYGATPARAREALYRKALLVATYERSTIVYGNGRRAEITFAGESYGCSLWELDGRRGPSCFSGDEDGAWDYAAHFAGFPDHGGIVSVSPPTATRRMDAAIERRHALEARRAQG